VKAALLALAILSLLAGTVLRVVGSTGGDEALRLWGLGGLLAGVALAGLALQSGKEATA
jgi:hypothetical protein